MKKLRIKQTLVVLSFLLIMWGCKITKQVVRSENTEVPASYLANQDTLNIADLNWKEYFNDSNLIALIDTALKNNQELNIISQEILVSKNEVKARKGEYLPFLGAQLGGGVEKSGEYTRNGAVDEQLEIRPGKAFPKPLGDFRLGLYATWEIDVFKKLHNAKFAAASRYLASIEGRNFLVTNLVSEIADSYYELMALDNYLNIIEKNIEIQKDALNVVKQQKNAAKVTQLAVNRFNAQLLNTSNLQYQIKQQIVETENRINFLTGRFPLAIQRSSSTFETLAMDSTRVGIPSQLLNNRPDIREAAYQLAASKLDVKVAKANFFPSFGISAGIGFQAFNPKFLFDPYSLLYNLAGDLIAPLINRNAIQAAYNSSNVQQLQAVYNYEETILNAYLDVLNQLAKLENYDRSHATKFEEVALLVESIDIANRFN
jgi:NodT family efflux transporter outer membrane factor (OMF) lipoprotein